jgi:hypothetical protein
MAGNRDHPLVMQYDIQPGWLDPVRHRLPSVRRRHEMSQGQILAAAIDKARYAIATVSYSRRRAYYAKRGKRYDPHPDLCSYDLIVPNVDLLADVGLLYNEIAAADPTSGRQSIFRATPALIEALGDMPPPAAKRKARALIQLRDEDKLPIDYRDTDDTTRMRRRLLGINEMVESVTLEVPPNVGERRGDLLIIGDSAVNLGNTTLYRIFNIDFKNGGRFSGHFVQGLPKKIRQLLTLGGEQVSEPDYPAHHLRILYALEGHPLPGDPYEVNGWERTVAKVALLMMINAPSRQSARGAIMYRFGLSRDDGRRLGQLADALEYGWESVARPNQLPPPGNWSVWLLLAGRGFGKTRVLSEMANGWATTGQARRIAIVAATAADARDVVVEGESGILATAPDWCRPEFQSGRRRLVWPNGCIGTLYSAEEPAD